MSKKNNVPEVRFKGFEGEWDTRPLYEYLEVSNEKNISDKYDKYDIYSVSREYGVINQIEYQGKSFAGASLLGYGVVHTLDVVYTKSPLKSQPYGIIKTNHDKDGIVSALYGVFHPKGNVSSTFVQTYFALDNRLNDYLRPLVNKGAKNTLLISDDDTITGKVIFPKIDEQENIVRLFTTLDTLIHKLEQKLEKLRNIKQALLNQMFINVNRGGYAIPLIRFKEFKEEWNKRVLADISQKIIDKNTMRQYNTVLTNSAEYGIINQRDFFDHDIANSSNIQGYYVISPNDYVYNPRISTIAPVGPINRNKLGYFGVMSPLYYAFRINKDSVCLDYLDFFFKSCMWHGFMYKNGNSGARSDRFSINDSVFVKMPIPCPNSTKEQKMIGAYFEKVENVVANTSSKLMKMRTMKQSLLQKMFA